MADELFLVGESFHDINGFHASLHIVRRLVDLINRDGHWLGWHRAEAVYAPVSLSICFVVSIFDGLEDVVGGHGSNGFGSSLGDVRLGNVNDAPFLKRILLSDHKKCMLQRRDMGHIDFSRAVFILQDK